MMQSNGKRPMKQTFNAPTRAEASLQAEDWWARQKGLRRLDTLTVAMDGPTNQWLISIVYEQDASVWAGPAA